MQKYLPSILIGVVTVVLVVGATFLSGCSLDRMLSYPTPEEVREVTGAQAKTTLEEHPYVRDEYVAAFKRGLDKMDARAEHAALIKGFIASAANTGLNALEGEVVGAVPGGAAIFALLGGAAGLFLPKPGTAKKEQAIKAESDREKREIIARAERDKQEAADRAWDEATEKTKQLIREGKTT